MSSNVPESIGRYRIVRLLGSGAMGDVYLAEDPHIDRRLAIKTVRVVGGTDEDIEDRKRRLLREARAAGKLLHPNVVALFDADDADGTLYLAFEFVDGPDLARRATVTPALTLRQVLTIAREVALALDYAHGEGIVHRDIKPSNILIGPGGVAKVADFGIAKLRDGSTELTRTGSVVGSPQYMSPEQVRGESLDGRSDLFSVGVLLYELLSRHRPFGGDTLSTLVFEILAKEPLSVDQLRPGGFPQGLVDLVHRLLAKDRDQRPASARDVAREIDALLSQVPAAMLDAPAVPGPPGPSRVAPGTSPSGARSPAVGGTPTPPSSQVSPVAPTATLDSAPTRPSGAMPPPMPPPPPPGAAPVAPMATPVATTLVQDPPSDQRPSPLDTGTYGGPKVADGRRGLLVAGAISLIVAGLGMAWWLTRPDAPPPPEAPAHQAAAASDNPADPPEPPTTVTPDPSAEPSDPADPPTDSADPTDASTGTDEPPAATGDAPTDQPSAAPPRRVPRPVRDRIAERRQTPPPPATSAPVTPPPPATQAPSSSPPPPTTTPPPTTEPATQPTTNPRIAAFDAAAAAASRELNTGLSFQFDVEPDDAIVKIQRRGERSLVQGAVSNFDPSDDDSRVLELPGPGDYLITLVHERYPDVVAWVHASAGRPGPHIVRMDMGRAATRPRGAAARAEIRSRGAFGFRDWPADAVVFADGKRIGTAAELPGRRLPRSASLRLGNGRHVVRIEVPGYAPKEITVRVDGSAGQFIRQIPFDRSSLEAEP